MKACALGIYLFVLIFAPLAFGTSEFWSMVIVQTAIGLGALLYVVSIWFFREQTVKVPGMWPLGLLLGYMVIQLIPLPPEVVRSIAPGTYDAYLPVLTSSETWIPLTVYQKATVQELLRIACYALFYFLTVQLLSDHRQLKKVTNMVVFFATAIAVLAIIQRVGSPDRIFWFRSVPDNAHPFGPWVNPNQYAGFMEMLIPVAFAVFLFYKPRIVRDESLRHRIIDFFTMPGANMHMLMGLAAVIMSLSVFVSLCRGGILTLIFSLFVFLILFNLKKSRHGKVGAWVVVGCIVVSVSWFGWGTVVAEFNKTVNVDGQIYDGRFEIWSDCYRMMLAFLPFGSGFGTFIDVFPAFKSFPGSYIFDHAHNDYIELLTDGGPIGFGLAAWFVAAVLKHGWKMMRARRDLYAVLLGIGALTGIMAMLLHSVTDFNMHNGAIGLYFFFLCGFLVTAVNVKVDYSGSGTLLRKSPVSANKLIFSVVGLFTVVTTVLQLSSLESVRTYLLVRNALVQDELSESEQETVRAHLLRARRLDPLEVLYSHELGALSWKGGDTRKSAGFYREAIRKNPMQGTALQWLGLLTHDEHSDRLIEEGYRRALHKDDLAFRYIEHLFWKGERTKAVATIQERLVLSPNLLKEWAPLFSKYSLSQDEITSFLAESVTAWIGYGQFLEDQGDIEGAEYYRSKALDFINNEPEPRPHWFNQLISYYQRTQNHDLAKITLHRAIEAIPDYAPYHLKLGDYYRQEGISYRAREEYETVLILDPGNRGAMRGLRKMGLLDSY